MKNSIYDQLLQRPWLVIVTALITISILSIGGKNLYFRGDYKTLFKEDNPQRVAFEEMQDFFNKSETVDILVVPEAGTIYNKKTLQLIKQLTEEGWQTPYSIRVNSITNFQHTYAQEDDLYVDKLYPDYETLTPEFIERIRTISLNDPELVNRLVSNDGKVAVISITVSMGDGDQTLELAEIASYVKRIKRETEANYADHNIYLTGVVMLNDAFFIAANDDASTIIPAMFLLILIMIAVMLRSVWSSLATLIIITTAILATLGFAGWTGFFLSVSTVNVPTMVMTIAVADCIHIIASWFQQMRAGLDREDALKEALSINYMPVIITSVTTSIGFLTLNFSDVPILADLGNLTAFGVMTACVLSLVLLPAILKVLPVRLPQQKNADKLTRLEIMGEWVTVNYRRILPYSVIIFVTALFLSSTNKLNDVAVNYFSNDNQFKVAADKQTEHLGGIATIDFGIYTGEISGINEPQVLASLELFTKWLQAQPEVNHVSSITDTYKKLNKNMNRGDDEFYKLPMDAELAAQYLLLFEMSLPYGLDLNNLIDMDKSATRITASLDNLGSQELTEFADRSLNAFNEIAPDLRIDAASPALMFAYIGETNMRSMLQGSLIALVVISFLLAIALKSMRLGIISLVPNLIPAGLGFGIWAIISGEINIALSVVLSMTLGIIVDDTVHFLAKYKRARNKGLTAPDSVRYTFKTTARALLVTTVVLALGFGLLSTSGFALNSDMGMLTAIILISALVIDLLFLPAFLLWLDKDKPANHS